MENKHIFSATRTFHSEAIDPDDRSARKRASSIQFTLINGEQVETKPILIGSCVEAIESYAGLVTGKKAGCIGILKNGAYLSASEREDGKVDIVAWDSLTGELLAGIYDTTTETVAPYCVKASGQNGRAVLLTLIPVLIEKAPAFASVMKQFIVQYDTGFPDPDTTKDSLFILNELMRLNVEGKDCLPLALDTGGNIGRITAARIKSGQLAPQTILVGSNDLLGYGTPVPVASASKGNLTGSTFMCRYSLGASLSADEKAMIPRLDDSYVLPQEVVDACEHVLKSTGKRNPVRNLLLRGPAGTGKTTMARAIASGLGLPYCKLTCNANTEIFDLLGQLFPDAHGKEQEGNLNPVNIEKYDVQEMVYDPESAYERITGSHIANVTPMDCFKAAMAQMQMVNTKQSGGQTYSYVESDLVRAMRYGWVVEIQEPSVITQPSVLVGLNGLLETAGSITLPNGEVIQRHPNCVVVMTTNVAYEGCRDLNQSVIDRCQLIMQIDDLSAETMADRAMAATDCADDDLVRRMVEVVQNADAFLQQRCISDGVVGMRGLLDWIESTEITGDPYKSALMTIINRATSDAEDRMALIETVLDPAFAPRRGGAA